MAAGLGLSAVFIGTLAVSAVAHLDAPSARRALAPILSDLASDPLKGRIEIKDIEHIALLRRGWIDIGEITVRDPEGTPVLSAYGAHVRFGPIQLVKAFLSKSGATPTLDRVVVDRVNVALIPSSEDGSPTLASAFQTKVPGGSPPGPPKSASTFRLAIADASIRELGVFGTVSNMPLDVRGQVLHANAAIMPDATWVNVEGLSLAVAPIEGVMNAPVYVDGSTEVRIPVVADPRSVGPELRNVRVALSSGDVHAFVSGHVEETSISAHVSVPQTSPNALAAVLGTPPPLPVPASLELDIHGTPDRADVVADAKVGDGTVSLSANVDLAALAQKPGPEQPRIGIAEGHLVVAGIAPRIFAPGAPALTVGTDAIVQATATTAGIEVTVKGTSTGAPEKGNAASVDVDAQALLGKGSVTSKGTVVASAEGARAEVRFDFEQHAGGGHANAAITANVPRVEDLAHFVPGLPIRGGVDVVANVGVDLEKQTFGATATVHGRSISHPSATIPEIAIVAHAGGTFTDPAFGAVVEAKKIVLSPKAQKPIVLHDVNAKLAGTPKLVGLGGHVRTDLGQDIDLATHLSPTPTGFRLAGTHVLLKRGDFSGDLAIKELALVGTSIKVSGFRLSSTAGGVRLDGTFDPKKNTMDFDVASTPLDVEALARAAGIEDGSFRGKLLLDVKLATLPASQRKLITEHEGTESSHLHLEEKPAPAKIGSGGAPYLSGRVHIDLHDGHADDVGDINAHVDVDVEDRLVAGTVDVAVKDLARVMVRGAAMVPGRLDDMKAWGDAIGRVDLHIPTVDLTKVEAFLAQRMKTPPPQLSGTFALHGHLERANKDGAPSGNINAWTRNFAYAQGATVVQGVDLRIKASVDSSTDASGEHGAPNPNAPMHLDLVVDAHDKKGELAIVHVGTEGTWNKLLKAGSALSDMPVIADVVVPARALHDLPPSIAKGLPIDGVVGLSATLRGTIGAPKLEVRATMDDVVGEGGQPHLAFFSTTYDGDKAKLHLDFAPKRNPDRRQVLLDAEVAFSAKDALAGKPTWSAKGDLELVKFPIGIVGGAMGLKGQANGKIHLDHVNDPNAKSATVDGRIDFAKLRIGDTAFDQAYVVVKVDDQAASGELVLHSTDGKKSGSIDAKGRVPLAWKNAASPSIAPGSPIEGTVDVKGLRLAILKPFIEAFDEIDGRLDAHLTAHVIKNAAGKWVGAPEGMITVRDGVIVAGSVGTRWSDITADVEVKNGKIAIKQIDMKSLGRGRAKITGEAVLDGFTPKTFHVQLDSKRFGIAASGAKIGDLTGKIGVDGKMVPNGDGRDRMDVVVTLDDITMDLAAEAGKKVQSLEEDPSIVVAQPIGKPVEPPKPGGSSMPMNVKFVIPHPIWVRRDDLRVAIDGNPTIAIDGLAKLSGEVVINANDTNPWQQRSWIEVAGKRFFIRESHVKFEGNEELDPLLDVHARWKAPDTTLVEVIVTGHVSAPKIEFKALDSNGQDAGLSKGEIMSLLVLGRRDAGSAQQQQQAEKGAASQAASLVEGMTGAILGRQLQKMLPVSVSLTVAPGRYAGGYQHDNVYFEVAYNAGGSQMGPTSIGQTQPKTTFSIDWRFAKMWSLLTTVGDTGATLVDLIWTYRY
jgi:hypothetical protein